MYLLSGIIGSIIGAVGTIIGGLLAFLIGKRAREPRPFLAFAGGMMVAVVFFDMLLESEELGGMMRMVIGTAAGGVFFALAEPLFSHSGEPSLYSTGILVLIGIAMHNLPEGLAVGSSLVESRQMAISLGLLMLVHDIPEGIVVCLPLQLSGMKIRRVFVLALITGLPTAFGAVLGTAIGSISREMISFCISFASGAMLYISLKELIPAAGKHKVFWSLMGLCVGFFMTLLI
jgi:ZIP family zinc transporter